MRPAAFLVVPLLAASLAGCTSGPTDQQPRSVPRAPAAGFHSVSYHGVSIDVPDPAGLREAPVCNGGLPRTGDLVVVLFDGSTTNCPAMPATGNPVPPRPATVLTVLLGPTGDRPALGMPDPRTREVAATGVTITASGPAAEVDAVFGSARTAPQDDLGCLAHIDPTVAPSNNTLADGSLIPDDVSRITVCEYAGTEFREDDGGSPSNQLWLVGSELLPDDVATTAAAMLRAGTDVERGAATTPSPADTPFLRLLVRGADGNTRTLQAAVNVLPEPVTDGRRTVGVDDQPAGDQLPTPFDAS